MSSTFGGADVASEAWSSQPAKPVQPAQPFNSQLSKQVLSEKLGLVDPRAARKGGRSPPMPSPPVKLEDAGALDALTNVRKFHDSFKPELVQTAMLNLIEQHGYTMQVCVNANGKQIVKYTVPWLVQPTDWPDSEWTEEEERAFVQGVLKGLVKPRFIVNLVRGKGRLLSGVCRLKAIVKWLYGKLSVMINGISVSRLQLPDEDRQYFDRIIINVTLYSHLTEADELELLQSLARPAWQ